MSGPKKPTAVFKVGDQAFVYLPSYSRGVGTQHVLVDVIDAKRTYVTVRAVNSALRLHPDKTEYHMQTGTVRNRDKFGNYAPRLVTLAEHQIERRTEAAHSYLEENGIFPHALRGFWKEQGAIALAQVLRQAQDDHYLMTRNEGNRS
jgi:hypothetical protein